MFIHIVHIIILHANLIVFFNILCNYAVFYVFDLFSQLILYFSQYPIVLWLPGHTVQYIYQYMLLYSIGRQIPAATIHEVHCTTTCTLSVKQLHVHVHTLLYCTCTCMYRQLLYMYMCIYILCMWPGTYVYLWYGGTL